MSQHSLRSFFKQFSEKKGRHLVIHSLKAGAATTLYAQTKDILLVRDFCDHESVSTTENYIHQQEDPNHMGTAILTENFDADKIDDLSIYLENNPKKKYASHYATILTWHRRDEKKKAENSQNSKNYYKRTEIVPDWFNKNVDSISPDKEETTEMESLIDEMTG